MKPLESLNHGFESTTHLNGSYAGNTCDFSGPKNNSQKVYPFVYDFQINDLPEPVRNLLIKQVTLEEISCYSGTNIKVLGSFVPTERKDNQPGLKPLYLHIQASKKQNIDRAVQRIKVQIQQAMNLPKYKEKVLIGLEAAPAAFDVRGKVLGPGGANLQYITNETGAIVTLRGRGSGFIEPTTGLESIEPLHLCVEHNKYDVLQAGRQLAFNLIETVQQEWYNFNSQQQAQPQNTGAVPQHINQPQGLKEKSRFNKDFEGSQDLYTPGDESDDDEGHKRRKSWDDRNFKGSGPRDQFQRSGSASKSVPNRYGSEGNSYRNNEPSNPRNMAGSSAPKYGKWKENGFERSKRDDFDHGYPPPPALEPVPPPGMHSGMAPLSQHGMPVGPMGMSIGGGAGPGVRPGGLPPQQMGGIAKNIPFGAGLMDQGGSGGFIEETPARSTPRGSGNNIMIQTSQYYPPVSASNPAVVDPEAEPFVDLNIAIVSEKYPATSVSQTNFNLFIERLNDIIIQMNPKKEHVYPAFKSLKLQSGVICAACKTEDTRMWLEKVLPMCTVGWQEGLRVMNPIYLTNLVHMRAKIPGPKPSSENLLTQLSNQNGSIDISKWSVLSINELDGTCWAVFTMDESQKNIVARNRNHLNYRFEEITLTPSGENRTPKWFDKN